MRQRVNQWLGRIGGTFLQELFAVLGVLALSTAIILITFRHKPAPPPPVPLARLTPAAPAPAAAPLHSGATPTALPRTSTPASSSLTQDSP